MKKNQCFVVDVWEGQREIDEQALMDAGVAGIVIRINDMNGGHHRDAAFDQQWSESANMIHWPYFVYNPWVSAYKNFDWLESNMPSDATAVAVDVEVRYSGITPAIYSRDLEIFISLCKKKWKTMIYTAEWFLKNLSGWPKNVDYWWAQYPGALYIPQTLTWQKLDKIFEAYDKPFNQSAIPGKLVMWQFSGDKLILPGSQKPIDVNVFLGSAEQLAEYIGSAGTSTPPVEITPSGLYQFSENNFYQRPGGGPLVLRVFFDKKMSDAGRSHIWTSLKQFLVSINPTNPSAIGLISATDWGPSKGLNGVYIKWQSLIYPGRNIVKIQRIENGLGVIHGITPGSQNPFDNPDVIHQVYDYNKTQGWGERARPVYVPILDGPFYVNMADLVSVDAQLPKTVRVTAFPWLNVRSEIGTKSATVARIFYGQSVDIFEVKIGSRGLWGRCDGGWVALRYNDASFTSWKI